MGDLNFQIVKHIWIWATPGQVRNIMD